jgi:hypothetical protein
MIMYMELTKRDDLSAMLEGYLARGHRVQEEMNKITRQLGGRRAAVNGFTVVNGGPPAAKKKPTPSRISPEGRERIRQAQLRRWAKAKKAEKVRPAAGA